MSSHSAARAVPGRGGRRSLHRGDASRRQRLFHPLRVGGPFPEVLGLEHPTVEGDGGGDALDVELVQGPEHPAACGLAVLAPHDQLGEQRVVVADHATAFAEPRVESDEGAAGRLEPSDHAGSGQEVSQRVLGVEAALDGVPAGLRAGLNGLPHGHEELQPDEVRPGDHLGHGVFHLEAGVHLDEEETAFLVHKELHCAGVHVPGGLGDGHSGVTDPRPKLLVDCR